MKKTKLIKGIAILACIPALALAACSSSGGRDTGTSTEGTGGAVADTPEITIAMITHAAPGDTFWDIVRKGAETAAAKDNVNLVYSGDPDGGRQAQLIQQAIDQDVDGIAVTFAKADAVKDAVANAIAAGIPVVGFNGGQEEALEAGVVTYVGQDDLVAGQTAGEKLVEDGFTHPICMIMEQGHVGLEARCAGIKEKVPGTEILYVQGTDMTQVTSTLTAKLQSTPDADIVMGLGAPFTVAAVGAVEDLGSDIKVGSFDMSADLAKLIADGSVVFTVDQQPYLQGYESVDALWLYNNGGFELGGGGPIATGPNIITTENAALVLEQAEKGIR
ncbi:substrate-binding domain-containing protein [Pseudoclavibacter helvolus]|uniref:Simple sugar transport system substrate-binding protein n=1 Tax=Pseudoclavibacter helvolus TaxID=255205 RepID=A0A7W4YGV6_9MICO|nr:simple sugar transport system substrate-binding protein [Pseudoclavibacter helvolus]